MSLAILAALDAEARALGRTLSQVAASASDANVFEGRVAGQRVVVGAGGVGRAPTEAMARLLLQTHRPQVMLVAGVAGALDPGLARVQTVISPRVLHCRGSGHDGSDGAVDEVRCDERLAEAAAHSLRKAGVACALSDCATIDAALITVSEKAKAWDRLDAGVVDMEAYWAGLAAREHGVPFLAIRVVLDRACERLPAFTRDWHGPEDSPKLVRRWLLRPWEVLEALLLQRRLAQALRALELAVATLAPALASAASGRGKGHQLV